MFLRSRSLNVTPPVRRRVPHSHSPGCVYPERSCGSVAAKENLELATGTVIRPGS